MSAIESMKCKTVCALSLGSVFVVMSLPGCSAERSDKITERPGSQFVGVWEPMIGDVISEADPAYTPAAQKSIDRQQELRAAGDPSGDYSALCIPPAMPTMTAIEPQEILLDDEKITWIMEATSGIRWIWLDGRAHPDPQELRLTANGHSIGHWEGDELVVDTIGFMNKAMVYTNLGRGGAENLSIYPSPQMRVVERIRVVEDGQVMISEREIYDPVNLVEPWRTIVRYERRDWEIGEVICMENNQLDFYFDIDELALDIEE